MTSELLGRALVEEATKKSGLIWVRATEQQPPPARQPAPAAPAAPARPLWHVWHDGAALLLGDGPGEQPLPALADGGRATVTVRSKDKGGRLVEWSARIVELRPGTDAWQAAAADLKGKRLNAPDGEAMTERWARECRILRLEPETSRTDFPDDSGAAPPPPTTAVTRVPLPAGLPRLLRKRGKGARRGAR